MKNIKLSSVYVIPLSFLGAILIGTILLALPIASADRSWTPLVDALFTATTSVCVTGLVVVDTFSYWSIFGQVVILLLIQIGGLGVITVACRRTAVYAGFCAAIGDRPRNLGLCFQCGVCFLQCGH